MRLNFKGSLARRAVTATRQACLPSASDQTIGLALLQVG